MIALLGSLVLGSLFYPVPSPLPAGQPGDVIWSRPLSSGVALPSAGANWLLLYHTRSATGADVAVSGTLAIPRGAPPPGGWPIISWAHGTEGNAPQCAPSHEAKPTFEQRFLDHLVALGYAIAQTDYEGEGTPGIHPYFVAAASAHDLTDIVRAARGIDSRIGKRWIVMGHSEGGAAAIATAAAGTAWAPELQLLGAVSYAPGSQIGTLLHAMSQSADPGPNLVLSAMMIEGIASADPAIRLSDILSPQALAALPELQARCVDELMRNSSWVSFTPASIFRSGVDLQPLMRDFIANEPGLQRIAVPLLLLQGSADPMVQPDATSSLQFELCQRPVKLLYRELPGENHSTVLAASLDQVEAWLADRFAGKPAPSNCS